MEWSSAEPSQTYAPYVNVEGAGQWAGPCAASPSNCSQSPDLRWQESEHNSAGHPRVISLIDDAPQQARRLCVTVQHPFAPNVPTGGTIQGTLILTDVDGKSRAIPFTIDKGQSSAQQCSPEAAPATGPTTGPAPGHTAGPFTLDPPKWWREGRALLAARGAKCETTHQVEQGGSWSFDFLECKTAIPKAVGVAFGGNPAAPSLSESCDGTASQGDPRGDTWYYNCRIFAFPGTSAKPNPATWVCVRQSFFSPGYGDFVDAWESEGSRGTRWPNRRTKTLAGCRAPRAMARVTPRSAGSDSLTLPAICSRACTATVTAFRNGRSVGHGRRTLKAWRERPIHVDLTDRARGATRLVFKLSVTAGKLHGSDHVTARVAGGTWRAGYVADATMRR
jgi:hypothetical protein